MYKHILKVARTTLYIFQKVSTTAYKLTFPPSMDGFHPVFHLSALSKKKKYKSESSIERQKTNTGKKKSRSMARGVFPSKKLPMFYQRPPNLQRAHLECRLVLYSKLSDASGGSSGMYRSLARP